MKFDLEKAKRERYLQSAWDEGARLGHKFLIREIYMFDLGFTIDQILVREREVEERVKKSQEDRKAYLASFG